MLSVCHNVCLFKVLHFPLVVFPNALDAMASNTRLLNKAAFHFLITLQQLFVMTKRMLMNLFSLRKKKNAFQQTICHAKSWHDSQNYSEIFVKHLLFGNPSRKPLLSSDEWNPVMN